MEILGNLVIPAQAARSTAKGSKFFTPEIAATVDKLRQGEGFVIPFLPLPNIKAEPGPWQLSAVVRMTKNHCKGQGKTFEFGIIPKVEAVAAIGVEGEEGYVAAVPAVEGGIAVKLVKVEAPAQA